MRIGAIITTKNSKNKPRHVILRKDVPVSEVDAAMQEEVQNYENWRAGRASLMRFELQSNDWMRFVGYRSIDTDRIEAFDVVFMEDDAGPKP